MLSGYPNPLYDQELAGWRRQDFVIDNKAAGGKTKRQMTEAVVDELLKSFRLTGSNWAATGCRSSSSGGMADIDRERRIYRHSLPRLSPLRRAW